MSEVTPQHWTDKIHLGIATVGGTGYLPFAPGTWGSIVAAVLFWFVSQAPVYLIVGLFVLLFLAGTWSSTHIENISRETDPGIIVIDEMLGMWISLLFVPKTFVLYLYAFLLFRIFDIVKVPPAKKLQELHGGWGVMLDDVTAGIYALILMHVGLFLF